MVSLEQPIVAAVDALIEADVALRRRRALAKATRGLTYDKIARRYRRGRRLLTHRQQVIRRDALANDYAAAFGRVVQRHAADAQDRDMLDAEFVALVGEAATVGYAFGRGGLATMSATDWQALSVIVVEHEGFAQRFLAESRQAIARSQVRDAAPSLGAVLRGIIERARRYADVVVAAYERARAAAFGLSLPVHPPIHVHCRCSWSQVVEDGRPAAYWRTSAGACPTCEGIAARYQPWRAGT